MGGSWGPPLLPIDAVTLAVSPQKVRERFYRPTSENLSGKKKILKFGPLAAEITVMQKSTEKHLSGIGLSKDFVESTSRMEHFFKNV